MSDNESERYVVRVADDHAIRVTTWQDGDEWRYRFHIDGTLIDEGSLGEDR